MKKKFTQQDIEHAYETGRRDGSLAFAGFLIQKIGHGELNLMPTAPATRRTVRRRRRRKSAKKA